MALLQGDFSPVLEGKQCVCGDVGPDLALFESSDLVRKAISHV